jgi:hypothetical protein
MITLKEVFLVEAPHSALSSLDKRIKDRITKPRHADEFLAQYSKFLELVDGLANSDLQGEQQPEEVAYRRDPMVDPFFKWLVSRTKRDLNNGNLDWDQLPNEPTMRVTVYRALAANAPKPVVTGHPSTPMSPEEHGERMHRGDYGKLDQ